MAIATLLPLPRVTFLDTNDNPLSGGLVYTYVPNTTTLKTTWQDAGQNILNDNPIVLDGDGTAVIYGSGQYFFIVYDENGNEIWSGLTQDEYGLVTSSNNTWTGTNTFTGPVAFTSAVTFSTSLTGVTNGGFINRFTNGAFDVSQVTNSGTITAGTPARTCDRWFVSCTGANVTWVMVGPFTGIGYSTTQGLQIVGNTGVTDTFLRQRIVSQDATTMSSQICTVQFGIINNTAVAFTPTLTVRHASLNDDWSTPVTDVNAVSLQTCGISAVTQVAYTFLASAGSHFGLEVSIDFGAALNSAAKNVVISGADVRVTPGATLGLNNTPALPELRAIEYELPACQYFLPVINIPGTSNIIANGLTNTSTVGFFAIPFPVKTRIPVTNVSVSAVGNFQIYAAAGAQTVTALTFTNATTGAAEISATVAAGLTTGQAVLLRGISTAGQLIFTGAEL